LSYHPKAYLSSRRNIREGLLSRSKVLDLIEVEHLTAMEIANRIGLKYRSVLYHLKLLESEGIVERKGKKPYLWLLTGRGQLRLDEALKYTTEE